MSRFVDLTLESVQVLLLVKRQFFIFKKVKIPSNYVITLRWKRNTSSERRL